MKSPNALLFPVVLVATLAGCGQTGPLYMPQRPAAAPAMTPVPAVPVQAPVTTAPVATPTPVPVQ